MKKCDFGFVYFYELSEIIKLCRWTSEVSYFDTIFKSRGFIFSITFEVDKKKMWLQNAAKEPRFKSFKVAYCSENDALLYDKFKFQTHIEIKKFVVFIFEIKKHLINALMIVNYYVPKCTKSCAKSWDNSFQKDHFVTIDVRIGSLKLWFFMLGCRDNEKWVNDFEHTIKFCLCGWLSSNES